MSEPAKGILAMALACMIWGLSPFFYRQLAGVAPIEILAHRTLWSLASFALILLLQGRLRALPQAFSGIRSLGLIAIASLMISANWFLFIFSVDAGRVAESSLGYYMFPLMAVLVGWLVKGERLAAMQWLAVGLAAVAVAILTFGLGVLPWLSLWIAATFVAYGLIKSWITTGPVVSVAAEVLVLAPVAILVLWLWGEGSFARQPLLLILSGPMTAVPLMLFSYASRRASMSSIGLMQYLNPSLQFACALILGEVMTRWHALAFPLIWLACAIYSLSALRQARRASSAVVSSSTVAKS